MASTGTDFGSLIEPVARKLWGDPNPRLSKASELRWGNHGARIVYPVTGAFYDSERGEPEGRGGTLDLIMLERSCDKAGALAWLEGEGLIEPRDTGASVPAGGKFYDYRGAEGEILFRVERRGKGKVPPFLQHGPDGKGGFYSGPGCMKDVERVPYRLPELLAARRSEPGATIYLCEGEKDVDRLASLGFIATTNPGGAGKWTPQLCRWIEGCRVVILEDNDDPGRDHARKVWDAFRKAALPNPPELAVLRLPGLPEKGDVSDWLDAGGTPLELAQLAEEAFGVPGSIAPAMPVLSDGEWDGIDGHELHLHPDYEPEDLTWPALDLAACAVNRPPRREWFQEGWVPFGKATLISGDGGVGKSLLEQQRATCVAMGIPFLGIPSRQAIAAYLSWEDDADELWRRQADICAALGVSMAALAGRLHLVSYTEEQAPFLVTSDADDGIRVTALGTRLERLIERHGIGFLALDNATQIAGIDHNATAEVAPFAYWLGKLAKKAGAVMLLHHQNKAGAEFIGSVAYNNQFRSRLFLERPDGIDRDARVLSNPKANYSQSGNRISFRWWQGAFVQDEDLSADARAALAETLTTTAANEAFLNCLRARAGQGEGRGVGPARGPNYAPAQFEGMTEAKGFKKEALRLAMERLFKIGHIETYVHNVHGKSRSVTLIRVVPNAPELAPEHLPNTDPEPARTVLPNTPPHTLYTTYNGRGPSGSPAPVRNGEAQPILAPGETGDEPVPGWEGE